MNLPETGWLGVRHPRPDVLPALGRTARPGLSYLARAHARARGLLGLEARRPGLTIVTVGFAVLAVSGVLEILNPGNY